MKNKDRDEKHRRRREMGDGPSGEDDPDAFECAGFAEYEKPLWLYALTADHEHAPGPRPQLKKQAPSRDPEEAEGLTAFEEMVDVAQKKADA